MANNYKIKMKDIQNKYKFKIFCAGYEYDDTEIRNEISQRALISEAGRYVELELNPNTYVLTAKLKDKNNNVISTSTPIDLPLESMIVDCDYDATTKSLIITLQNGNTTSIPLGDLIDGLATEEDLNEVRDNLEVVQNELNQYKTIYNVLPKVEDEGEELTLDDTGDATLKMDLKGNTSQFTTTGKNLLNESLLSTYTNNGIKWEYENSKIKLSGQATSTYSQSGRLTINLPAGTYTLSKFGTTSLNYNCWIYNSGGTLIANTKLNNPFTINESASLIEFFVEGITSGTSYNQEMNFMVSTSGGDYEPYTGGIASPNPSYPQDVHVVSGDNTIIVNGNNLFDEEYYRNATYTINTYKNTKLNIANRGKLYFKAQLKPGKNEIGSFYLCLCNKQNPNNMPAHSAWAIYGTIVQDGSQYQNNYATFDETDDLYFTFYPTSVSVDTIFDTYNLLISSDNITYVPFQGLKDYQVNLGVENLWKNQLNGFIPVTGAYPTTNSTYPNSRYIAVKLLKGHSLTLSGSTDNYGRCRYIDIDTNQSVGTITSSVVNDYYTSTGDFSNGFVEGTITAKKDFIVGIMDLRATANSLVVNYGAKQTISEAPIELCKMGDYQDYFYKDNGSWYLHKEIGKVVLNGSEAWTKSSNTNVNRYYIPGTFINTILNPNTIDLISDYFTCITPTQSDAYNVGLSKLNNTSIMANFSLSDTSFDTLQKFTTWLSTHNVILYYVLATPTTEEITNTTLISQLDALESAMGYKGQTNISQINNDAPFIIDATALKDLSSL